MKIHATVACLLQVALTALCLTAAGTPSHAGAAAQAAPDDSWPILTCDGVYRNRTFKHVRVRPGDTCVLRDSVVTGNFKARNPETVRLIDTALRRNVMVRGATEDVVIGNSGCRFDPTVGNNLVVRNSHNVVICWMTVKNNIKVVGNDGRISLFNNKVGSNISVSRNEAYVADPGTQHKSPGAIRLRHNTAGQHIRLADNDPSRTFRGLATNTPTPELI